MNYRWIPLVMLLILLTIGFVACMDLPAFEDEEWVLELYGVPGDLQTVLEGSEITATFDSDTHEVSGSAGCNSYFGDYEVDYKQLTLTISALAYTEMACLEPEGVMEQEQQYLDSLVLAEIFEKEDVRFHIICSDGAVLVFRNDLRE